MEKKFRLLFLLALLMTAVTGAWAQPWTSGACTVTFSDGVMTVSGTGAMANYADSYELPWDGADIKTIVIESGVTSIGVEAFSSCSKLESVSIPASVTSIGEEAFYNCGMLAKVSIYAPSLTTYGSYAFHENAAGRKIYVLSDAVDTYKAGWSAYAADIEAMPGYTVSLKDGTQDAGKWTVKAGTDGSFQSLPLKGVTAGTKVKLKYDGDRSMLKGVTAMKVEKKAAYEHSITIAVDPSTTGAIATAPAMTIEFNTGETWADVAARYDWLDTYLTSTVFYKDDTLMGDVHDANGGVKPDDTIDPNGSYHWGM